MAATAQRNLAPQPALTLRSGSQPASSVPQTGSQPKSTTAESSLWELAAKELDKKDYDRVGPIEKNNANIVTNVLKSVQKKKDDCITNQWSYTSKGKKVKIRDLCDKIIHWTTKFEEVGDFIVSMDVTGHAALPWAAVKFVIEIAGADSEKYASSLEDMEFVTREINYYAIFEALYIQRPSDTKAQLSDALKRAYKIILEYLSKAKHYYDQNAFVRFGSAKFGGDDLHSIAANIEAMHPEIERYASLIDTQYAIKMGASLDSFSQEQQRLGQLLNDWKQTMSDQLSDIADDLAAGSGKTGLTSIVIQDLLTDPNHGVLEPVAFFYCSRDPAQAGCSDPTELFRSIVRQLACPKPGLAIRAPVLDKYTELSEFGSRLDVTECAQLIVDLIRGMPSLTIVVDAMDECDKVEDVFQNLAWIRTQSTTQVKVFMSSRDIQAIAIRVQDKNTPNFSMSMEENTKDIGRFVETAVDDAITNNRLLLPPVIPFPDDLRGKIIDSLKEGAQGMFLWVKLQLDHLSNSNTPNEVEQKLGRLPTELEAVYDKIYTQIEGDTSPGQKRESLIIAENALRLLLCARVLLPTNAFLTAIRPQHSGPISAALLLTIASNLIVQDVEQDTFRLAHLSVREYLERRPEYNEMEIHSFGAEICLTQLTKRRPHSDDQEKDVMEHYAIIYGPFHCQLSGEKRVQDELRTLMKSFLMPRNLTKWMEVLPSILSDPDFYSWGVPWELQGQLFDSITSPPSKFLLACAFGFTEVVKDPKVPVDAQNQYGRTALHLASTYGHDDIVQLLLDKGAKTDVLDDNGKTPLCLAVSGGHLRAAEILLEHDNVTEISEDLLIASLWSGDPDTAMMKLLLDRDEELVIPEGVLVEAIAKSGNELIDLIEFLYKLAHDMQITNAVLGKGISAGNVPAIEYLLAQDGDISIDEEILKLACTHLDGPAILSCLSKAYPKTRIPESVLQEALRSWRMEAAYLLLDWDPELKVSPDLLEPVVSITSFSFSGKLDNNAPTVERLISRYSETTLSEDILSAAAGSSNGGDILEVMLKRFPDVEITDTVLQAAVSNPWRHEGFLAFKQLLPRCKGEIDIDSLLRAAMMLSNEEAVCCILDQHKEIEITEDLVITSIQVTGSEPTCGLLLDRNPAITVNENILLAAAYMRNKCLQTLLARDSSINISREVLVTALPSHRLELLKPLFDRATGVQIDEEIMAAAVENFEDPVEALNFVYQRNPQVKLPEEVLLRVSRDCRGEAVYTRLLELYGKLPIPEKLWEQEYIDDGAREWLLEHDYRPAHLGEPPENIQERIELAAILGYPKSVELYVECAGKDASFEKWITIAKIFNAAEGKPKYKDQLAELLASGVDPNFQRPLDGSTALMVAASNGKLDVVKTMLENKDVNIEAVDNCNKRALILAIEAGKEEVVELLFEHGAIFGVFGDFTSLNAWSVAKQKGFKGVLEVLKKYDVGMG